MKELPITQKQNESLKQHIADGEFMKVVSQLRELGWKPYYFPIIEKAVAFLQSGTDEEKDRANTALYGENGDGVGILWGLDKFIDRITITE